MGNDLTLRDQLLTVEADFLDAMMNGPEALEQFQNSWSSLHLSIQRTQTLDDSTLEVAYSVSQTISILSESLLELSLEADQLSERLTEETRSLLSDNDVPTRSNNAHSMTHTTPYIQIAYQWLLQNLHNPYPSPQVRASISKQTSSLCKDVDAWFTDARKRIGWNSLRRRRFSNKRADIIDAATRFFIMGDAKRALEASIESEFAALQARVQDLYSSKFTESALASKLEVAVNDMSPETKTRIKEDRRRKHYIKRQKRRAERDALPYPSPECSPGTSSQCSLPSPTSTINDLLEPIRVQSDKKRGISKRELSDGEICDRSWKRIRVDTVTSSESPDNIGLPSPAPSVCEITESLASRNQALSVLQMPSCTLNVSTKRKRCPSDADALPVLKRRSSHHQSHCQILSDPFPSNTLSERSFDVCVSNSSASSPEFSTTIPPPVSVEAPDLTAPLDIEIFSFPPWEGTRICGEVNIDESYPSVDAELGHEIQTLKPTNLPASGTMDLLFSDEGSDWFGFPSLGPQEQGNLSEQDSLASSISPYPFGAAATNPTFYGSLGLSSSAPPMWIDAVSLDLTNGPVFANNADLQQSNKASLQLLDIYMPRNCKSSLSSLEKEAKKQELIQLEAKLLAIRAEIAAVS